MDRGSGSNHPSLAPRSSEREATAVLAVIKCKVSCHSNQHSVPSVPALGNRAWLRLARRNDRVVVECRWGGSEKPAAGKYRSGARRKLKYRVLCRLSHHPSEPRQHSGRALPALGCDEGQQGT